MSRSRNPETIISSQAIERSLPPREVATLFRVDPKTLIGWANGGRINCFRTPTNQRRYPESEVRKFLGDWTDILLDPNSSDRLLTPNELIEQFDIHPHTLEWWVSEDKINYVKTPTGDYRFLESEVLSLPIQDSIEDEKLFTTNKVAAVLNVNPRTVTRMAENGEIDSIQTTEGLRIPEREVRRLVHGAS